MGKKNFNYINKKPLEEYIKEFLEENGYEYAPIKNKKIILMLYTLYILNIEPDIDIDSIEDADLLRRMGIYYEIKKMYDRMIKFYTMAYEKGDGQAAYNLGIYYDNKYGHHNAITIRTYLIAIELGNIEAIRKVADYYSRISDTEKSIQYYEMLLNLGDNSVLYHLGVEYYIYSRKQIEAEDKIYNLYMMKKCFNTAFNINNEDKDLIYTINRYLEICDDPSYAQNHWAILNDRNSEKYEKYGVCAVCEI